MFSLLCKVYYHMIDEMIICSLVYCGNVGGVNEKTISEDFLVSLSRIMAQFF